MPLQIHIDRQTCIGSGNCCFHAPATFDLDGDLKATVINPSGDSEEAILRAADGCPTRSIRIDE
jgi:ferredoxin